MGARRGAGGTDTNLAYVFAVSPSAPAPPPGPPEPARYDQVYAERSGVPAPATPPAPAGEALAVLCVALE